jgi:orotate phosphoribosyltransferase
MTTRYPPAETVAALAAPMLLEAQAVHFNAREPFTHASGRQAPTYVDCRRLISYPRLRARLMDLMVETVSREAGEHAFDVIAGGETAGIPFAAWVAERMGLPMAYIRKKPKGYGRNARIEGVVPEAPASSSSRTSPPTAAPSSASSRRSANRAPPATTPQ